MRPSLLVIGGLVAGAWMLIGAGVFFSIEGARLGAPGLLKVAMAASAIAGALVALAVWRLVDLRRRR